MRIASLLPSATEIVYALGLGGDLVAVSHDCDYPPDVSSKLRLTSIDIEPSHASSREIDEWVEKKVHRGLSVYHIDQEALKKANPDLILTQELCEVCAPSFTDVQSACKILDGDRKIISLEPTGLAQIAENILTVGEATERREEAKRLVATLRERIRNVEDTTKSTRDRPRVFCMEWLDPIFVAGHWVPEMVSKAGGVDELGRPHQPSVRIDWKEAANYDPEILILMPCGFDLKRTTQDSGLLKSYEGWEKLRAVRDRRVFAVDGSAYFNRPGPRIVDGLEIMAEILHPEIFSGGAPEGSYAKLGLGAIEVKRL